MRYISHILFPGERVLLNARVHPVLLLPGLALIAAAIWVLLWYGQHAHETYAIARFGRWLYPILPSGRASYALATLIVDFGRSWGTDTKLIAFILLLPGVRSLALNWELIAFTELVITERRVIAKTGVITTTTIEIDRRRITEVSIRQSMMGRLLNYGTIYLQGFAGSISGLPVIARPYQLQQALAA